MMKRIAMILVLACALSCDSGPAEERSSAPAVDTAKTLPAESPAPPEADALDFQYATVIAYATAEADLKEPDPAKKIGPDTVSRQLSPDDLALLREAVNSQTPAAQQPADCYNPRHFILFLDGSGKIVEHIGICFECTRMKSSRPQLDGDLKKFESFFEAIGLPVFLAPEKHSQYYNAVVKTKRNRRR